MRARILLLIMGVVLCGCVHALRPYNQPSEQKLRIQSPTPQEFVIRVGEQMSTPVPADGRVTIMVPALERGCATYLFGVLKIKDSSPCDVRAIHVNKGQRTIQKLSLNELAKLPVDESGYRLVKVEK